ncbi:thermonuclease family protein [Calidifontibacter indicus]|uniref:thermonuclease family protein n=1 Tax=Calidifontibacter indicus TaxID=419650 RepID=UPI003D7137F8
MPRRSTAVFVLSALALTACQSASDTAHPVAGDQTSRSESNQPNSGANSGANSDGTAAPSSTSSTQASAVQASSAANAASGDLLQVAGITDGDTIKVWVNGQREPVRLLGVDTPESKKPNTAVACYAKEAASKMQSLVQSKQVRLVADPTQADRDRYNRLVRYVVLPDGSDVSQLMIAGGFGREYTDAAPYAKQGAFRVAQSQAQAAKRGLWGACTYASAFNPPSTSSTPSATNPQQSAQPSTTQATPSIRTTTPARPSTTTQDAGACDIKGNISSSGEKIYHVPGQRHYAQTQISPGKGERWFCSESEAQNAGWRRSKV